MTALTKEQFAALCDLLPADMHWGEPLMPHTLHEILERHTAGLRAENERLRAALLEFVDQGCELSCDECGGEPEDCPESCPVRRGRAALADGEASNG